MFGAPIGTMVDRKIGIIVSAKAGCTTVHEMCQRLFDNRFDRMDSHYFILNRSITFERIEQWLAYNYVFRMVVRNPNDRIISCFITNLFTTMVENFYKCRIWKDFQKTY